MPILSAYARTRKLRYFIDPLPKHYEILEIGSGDCWLGNYCRANGWTKYESIDIASNRTATYQGDIRSWESLNLQSGKYDAIVAFEVLEHVDCIDALYALLQPGGLLFATTPWPPADSICRALEVMRMSQRRTSPHSNLLYLDALPQFDVLNVERVGMLSQWGVFRKPFAPAA